MHSCQAALKISLVTLVGVLYVGAETDDRNRKDKSKEVVKCEMLQLSGFYRR